MIKPKLGRMSVLQNPAIVLLFSLILTSTSPVNVSAQVTEVSSSPKLLGLDGHRIAMYLPVTRSTVKIAVVSSTAEVPTTTTARLIKENEENIQNTKKAKRLDAYFSHYNMPLAGYGDEFVRAANKYGLDWRLLPAIGVIESTGGKFMRNNNPFGWGSARIKFSSISDAIDKVSKHLGGHNPSTARMYKNTNTKKKLHYYNSNGTYAPKVMRVMESFQ